MAAKLEDIPNVGPATARVLRKLGIRKPEDLEGHDAFEMYDRICKIDNMRYDPCVYDVFMAAIHFQETGQKRTWWSFTKERKKLLAELGK